MIVRARVVIPMDGAAIEDGAVVIKGNRVVAVGPASDLVPHFTGQLVDLGEVALMPGLINAHCHLDYTVLRNAISPQKDFSAWVQRINAIKRTLDTQDWLDSIAKGFAECRRFGTTTVCNIEAFPELMPHLPPAPLRTWWFYEMIDIRHRITTDEVVAGALAFFEQRKGPLDYFGLSPHAPFTASTMLYGLANECARRFAMPLTTHVAESRDEYEMFRHAKGALHEFLAILKRPMEDCGARPPFSHLWHAGAINGDWLLVHMNELDEDDFALLAGVPREGRPHVVHCPGSHQYFRHSPFPLERLRELGVNVCVGTDSLASNDTLSLLAELRRLGQAQPALSGRELLEMVTLNPARALGQTGQLGVLRPGALADLIAIPGVRNVQSACEAVVEYTGTIPWLMIDGQILP